MTSVDTTKQNGSVGQRSEVRYLGAFHAFFARVADYATRIHKADMLEPAEVKRDLLVVLEQQRILMKEVLPEHEFADFLKAQYVMVAVADEVLLGLEWSKHDEWAKRPLEAEEPFGTHVAGDRIFDDLEGILELNEPVTNELLTVYLAALSLGFRGRYRFDAQSSRPEHDRGRITKMLRSEGLLDPSPSLCSGAVAVRRRPRTKRSLPSFRAVTLPLMAACAIILCVGQIAWLYVTSGEVRERLSAIEEARNRLSQLQLMGESH